MNLSTVTVADKMWANVQILIHITDRKYEEHVYENDELLPTIKENCFLFCVLRKWPSNILTILGEI